MFEKQLEAFEKFAKLKVGALFMSMGTGKTRIALELVNFNKIDFLVYVCPVSSIQNIQNEIDKWGVNCNYKIIGYETIQASDRKYLELLSQMENKKCFIIADESIFIKNEQTKRFQRLCFIRKNCEYALILNGTPLTKNEWDLYNQMYFLSPLILKMNRSDFQSTFFTEIRYKKKGFKEKTFHKFSEINAQYLTKLIEPYVFYADLDFQKLEDEEKIFIPYYGDKYNERKEKTLEKIKHGFYESQEIINMLNALNVIASTYDEKNKAVAEYIKDKQVIVFCSFLEEITQISKIIDCHVITGQTKNRHEIRKAFEEGNKPLLMTYGVGAYSLNLQFCNEIFFSSINFDYGKVEQAKHRIRRIGQERDIKYTYFLTDLGITKMVLDNLSKKQTLKNLVEQKIQDKKVEEWIQIIN